MKIHPDTSHVHVNDIHWLQHLDNAKGNVTDSNNTKPTYIYPKLGAAPKGVLTLWDPAGRLPASWLSMFLQCLCVYTDIYTQTHSTGVIITMLDKNISCFEGETLLKQLPTAVHGHHPFTLPPRDWDKLFNWGSCDRTGGSKLKEDRFRLNIRKKYFMMQMLLMLHHWKHSRLHSEAAAVISFLLSCLKWLVTCCNPGILPSGLCCNGCVGEIPAPRAHHTLVLQRKLQECCSSCRATSAIEY